MAGEVYVIVISDDPRRFEPGSQLIHADGRELTVRRARRHRDRFLVTFEGFTSRPAAEGLRGALFVDPDDVRELGDDEYWSEDLVGCLVVHVDGREVGTVGDVVASPAHDLLSVATAAGERLVPVVKEIVREVDPAGRRIVVDPPDGLLDP